MFLPKVIFEEMSLEENIDIIKWMYFDNNDVFSTHDFIIKYFPELANLASDLPRAKIYEIIAKTITSNYNKNKDRIAKDTEKYNSIWKKYNDKYLATLSSYLGINWPNNRDEIVVTVGLIPVFPRNLDDFSFSIGIGVDEEQLLMVCAHETLHFLWFEKWRQIHPETPRREYDTPYLVWQYSEMVTDPILNNKPFSDMFDFKERGYDSFYEIEENGSKVMDNLRNLYSKDIPIEEKINQGYEYISSILDNKESLKK